jgi:large subunit ribosomal protein L25
MAEVRVDAETRTEFGKGAARRTRRAGKIPAVLYGHGVDPQHLAFDAVEFARVMRLNGRNAVLSVTAGGAAPQTALTKTVVRDPIKGFIEHVDLLAVRRGEKVQVDVPIVSMGEAAPGTLVFQDTDTLTIEADALNIPDTLEVVIEDLAIGTQVLAGQITLPEGSELVTDPEALVINVTEAPTEDDMEAEVDAEGAGVEEDAPEEEAAETGEASSEAQSSGSSDGDSSGSDSAPAES